MSSGDLKYSMGTTVNNTAYFKFFKKVAKYSHHQKKKKKKGRKENGNYVK